MTEAFTKLLAITLGTLILCVIVVFGVRSFSSHMQYEAPDNPWFKKSFWWVYQPSKEDICSGTELETQTPTKDWIIELPIKRVNDEWVIPCKEKPLNLVNYLKTATHTDWLIDVQAHDTWGLDQLADGLNGLLTKDHFGLTADAQKVGVFLRKKAPEWLFAADSSTLLRLHMFESLYLENAFEFSPDFVLAKLGSGDGFQLDTRAVQELHRRKKRILIEWNDDKQGVPTFPFDGILTTRPSAAWQKFSSSH